MAYITPLAGGLLADRLLGVRATCVLGGVLMSAGHLCMAYEASFLFGLLLLVLGNGRAQAHDLYLLHQSILN